MKFEERLRSWSDLRESAAKLDTTAALTEIIRWWANAPIANHVVHWNDFSNWPDPWDLLVENHYCDIALALGIAYTVIMVEHLPRDIIIAQATDEYGSDCVLVMINQGEIIMNYDPQNLLNNQLDKFTIKNSYNFDQLNNKIGK